ncbi:translation initiation factor IF-2-like [Camelus ferus]|uniref:Translation initiation factor IF-2-like n=1 Tax=Camelus ferus TaxID=419612 RepID=A0A8B8U7I6_CAMFR|nr:translation initiation factor IF-2-like [Camelus ferus]
MPSEGRSSHAALKVRVGAPCAVIRVGTNLLAPPVGRGQHLSLQQPQILPDLQLLQILAHGAFLDQARMQLHDKEPRLFLEVTHTVKTKERKKQAAASAALMMPKEGTELVISQVFPLGAQTEGLEADKTESLLHSNFDVNMAPLGQESAGGRSDSLNVAPHTPGGLYRDVGKGRNHRSSQRSHLAHPTRPHPPGSLIWNLEAEHQQQQLPAPLPLPRAPASLGQWPSRRRPRPRGRGDRARGSGRIGQQVLTGARTAQPGSSPARGERSLRAARASPLPAAATPGPAACAAAPGLPSARPPPAAAAARGAGARPGAAGAAVAAEGGGGDRRARPFAGGDRGCAACGAEWERGRRGPATVGRSQGPGGPSAPHLPPPPRRGGPGGRRDQPGRGRFSWLVTETVLQLFWAPLRVCLGPAPGSFRTRQTEDLATRAPGRCPLRRRCERALAGALPLRASRPGAGPGAPARLRAYGRRLTTEPSGSLKGLFSPFIQASLWSKGKRVS